MQYLLNFTLHMMLRVNAASKKVRRWQICGKSYTAEELVARAHMKLFQKSQFPSHCIHLLLPLFVGTSTPCRKRGHPSMLNVA